PTDGKIIDEYVSLFHRPLSNAPKLAKFEISQTLHPEPYTCAKYRQNQAQCVSGGPQKKQAKQSEKTRHRIKHDYHLPGRHAALQQLVMDVLTIGRKYRSAADEAPQHGESGL